MTITKFIQDRLVTLESRIMSSQMNINGVNINNEMRRDINSVRRLLHIANQAAEDGDSVVADQIRMAIAARWASHPAFERAWMTSDAIGIF